MSIHCFVTFCRKIDEDKGKTSLSSKKTVSERLEEKVSRIWHKNFLLFYPHFLA